MIKWQKISLDFIRIQTRGYLRREKQICARDGCMPLDVDVRYPESWQWFLFLTSGIPCRSARRCTRAFRSVSGDSCQAVRSFRGELKWDPVAEEGSVPRETRWPWYTSSVGFAVLCTPYLSPRRSFRHLPKYFSTPGTAPEIALFCSSIGCFAFACIPTWLTPFNPRRNVAVALIAWPWRCRSYAECVWKLCKKNRK